MPTRLKNHQYRDREHLFFEEVLQLLEAARYRTRYPIRNQLLILLMFRHGLRAGEAALLKWESIRLEPRTIYIRRLKRGRSGVHGLQPDEVDLLQRLQEINPQRHLFVGERAEPMEESAISQTIKRIGERSDIPFPIHAHMLRHACGYYLAEQGIPTREIQEYLGHVNIQQTVRYTAANPKRFERIQWEPVQVDKNP